MLPGSLMGVVIAGFLLSVIPKEGMSLLVGGLSLLFVGQYLLNSTNKVVIASPWFWIILGGFSSTTIHAGGGPISIYLLPKKLDKVALVATMALLFGVINLFKLVPYALLGLFDSTNLLTAVVLMPLAPVGVKLGVFLLHRVSQEMIYRLCYLFLLLSGLKLVRDGLVG